MITLWDQGGSNPQLTDYFTTSTFIDLYISCGLDYIITFNITCLGASRVVSEAPR